MSKSRRLVWWLLVLVCAGVLIFSAYTLIARYAAYGSARREYAQLAETVRVPAAEADAEPEAAGDGESAPYVSPIDFDALAEINPDIVAWITLEGTEIDYPVVRGGDNDWYLDHSYSGASSSSGAIFLDYRCTGGPGSEDTLADGNTIIYGHEMRDGSMFAALTGYKDQDFYDEHPTFTIYTPEGEYSYAVISAYVADAGSDTYRLGFSDEADFADYLDTIVSRSTIQAAPVPEDTAQVITLSTCDATSGGSARMVIHGVLDQMQAFDPGDDR